MFWHLFCFGAIIVKYLGLLGLNTSFGRWVLCGFSVGLGGSCDVLRVRLVWAYVFPASISNV